MILYGYYWRLQPEFQEKDWMETWILSTTISVQRSPLRILTFTGGLLNSASLRIRAASCSVHNTRNGNNMYLKLCELYGKQHFQNYCFKKFLILIWNKIISLVKEEDPAFYGILGLGVLVFKEEVGRGVESGLAYHIRSPSLLLFVCLTHLQPRSATPVYLQAVGSML